MDIREKLEKLQELAEESVNCASTGDYADGRDASLEAVELADEIVEAFEANARLRELLCKLSDELARDTRALQSRTFHATPFQDISNTVSVAYSRAQHTAQLLRHYAETIR